MKYLRKTRQRYYKAILFGLISTAVAVITITGTCSKKSGSSSGAYLALASAKGVAYQRNSSTADANDSIGTDKDCPDDHKSDDRSHDDDKSRDHRSTNDHKSDDNDSDSDSSDDRSKDDRKCGGQTGSSGLVNGEVRTPLNLTFNVTTIAGRAGVRSYADGVGSAARFNVPRQGFVFDGRFFYIVDSMNHVIRCLDPATNEVTTLAGSPGVRGAADGIGAAASFNLPFGMATDGTYLYVADFRNHTIRRVTIATREVKTIAGLAGVPGSVDGIGTAVRFDRPIGLATVTDGSLLYVSSLDRTIRRIDLITGSVSTIAGTPNVSGSTDGIGAVARFSGPAGMTLVNFDLYIADAFNCTIRKLDVRTNAVTTFAGAGGQCGRTDGIGTAARLRLGGPATGLISDSVYLYFTDGTNNTVRRISLATATVMTIAGSPLTIGSDDGAGSTARFNFPRGIASDGVSLFVLDTGNMTVRKIQ